MKNLKYGEDFLQSKSKEELIQLFTDYINKNNKYGLIWEETGTEN